MVAVPLKQQSINVHVNVGNNMENATLNAGK